MSMCARRWQCWTRSSRYRTVTFTQDEQGGTKTTLEVVNPAALNGGMAFNVGP